MVNFLDITNDLTCSGIISKDNINLSYPYSLYLWKMLLGKVDDDSTGAAYYINDAGEIVTIPAESPLYVDAKFWSMGSWDQMCANPYDPSQWTLEAATRTATGNIIGDFTEYSIADIGGLWNRAQFYSSVIHGNPTGKQYGVICYNFGTSESIRIQLTDGTAAKYSIKTSSFPGVWVDVATSAGTLTILSDFLHPAGFRIALFTVKWNTPSNYLTIGVGPNSNDNSNVLIYFSSLNELGHIWPFTGPGSTTIANRAGTTTVPMEVGGTLDSLLDGKAGGNELVVNGNFKTLDSWSSINNPNAVIVTDGVNISYNGTSFCRIYQYSATKFLSKYLEFRFNVSAINGTWIATITDNTNGGGGSEEFEYTLTTSGYYILRTLSTALVTVAFRCYSNASGNYLTFNNVSVREISSVSFKLKFDWTPRFSYSDLPVSTTGCILHGGTQNLLQFRTDASGNGYIDLLDGTHTVSVALDWEYGTAYSIQVNAGWNESLSGYKMQLVVGATASSVSDFDGSFDPDTAIVLGELTDYPQAISPLIFDKVKAEDWK